MPKFEERAREARALLQTVGQDFHPAVLASSLGAEDMVLTDLICSHAPSIEIVTLDTGRLPAETYEAIDAVVARYGPRITVLFPEARDVESYVSVHGVNAFYSSIELRRSCCEIRKVKPLRRALTGKRAWITGLRRSQSITRATVPIEAFDSDFGLTKFNPLADWSETDVWSYLRTHDVPYHPLHDRGYPSIGCAPCTRAVTTGEDARAGRWWWENPESKECGLHVQEAGRLARAREPA